MERITMKDLPKEQRPYEKCMAYGPKALTDSELLAVIIRTGSSERTSLELADAILSQNAPGDGLTGLLHCSLEQLQSIRGVGPVKGIQLLCIGELSRRIWKQKVSAEPVAFTQPEHSSSPAAMRRNMATTPTWKICVIWNRRKSMSCF